MTRLGILVLSIFLIISASPVYAGQNWKIDLEKSRIDFIGKSTLHDFNGRARELSGVLENDSNFAKGVIDVDVAGLTTNEPERDKNMYQMFDGNKYPQIHFVFNDTDLTKVINHHDGEIKFTGIMTIHHISHPVILISKGHLEENTLVCEGKTSIHLKEYALKPPSIFGIIRVSDEVVVQYKIVFLNR